MIKLLNLLKEALSDIKGTPLYHTTSIDRGLKIIDSDSLLGSLPSEEYLKLDKKLANTKTQKSISLTRDKNWKPDQSIGKGSGDSIGSSNIIFVLDKNKLKTKYKLEPFNYYALDPNYKNDKKGGEYEERLLTDKVSPLRPYVMDIIYKGSDENIKNIISNYLKTEK